MKEAEVVESLKSRLQSNFPDFDFNIDVPMTKEEYTEHFKKMGLKKYGSLNVQGRPDHREYWLDMWPRINPMKAFSVVWRPGTKLFGLYTTVVDVAGYENPDVIVTSEDEAFDIMKKAMEQYNEH